MKKLLRITVCILSIFFLCSFEENPGMGGEQSSTFWGWEYNNISGTIVEGGTGHCFREASATKYIFWIEVAQTQKYQYVDCASGASIGGWVDSLMGY